MTDRRTNRLWDSWGEGQGLLQTGQRDWRQLDLRALSLSGMARGSRFEDRKWEQYGLENGRLSLQLVVKQNGRVPGRKRVEGGG